MTIEKPELIKRRSIPKQKRDRVFERDSEGKISRLCPICGINEIRTNTCECGHIIAWVNSHNDEEYNLISVCPDCNGRMHDTDMDIFMLQNYPTRRKELENGIKDGKEWIKQTEQTISEFLEELKTLPEDPKIWSMIKQTHVKIISPIKIITEIPTIKVPTKIQPFVSNIKRRGEADIKLEGFTFNGKEYITDKYVDIVRRVCDNLSENHKTDFEKIALSLNKYFSKNEKYLRIAYNIPNTKIFVERNLGSSETTIKNVREIIEHFGYSKNDLIINTE